VTLIEPQQEYWGCDGFGLRPTGTTNAEVIVGSCADTGYIYDHGVYTFFNGSLGGPLTHYIYPYGINDKGTIFGLAEGILEGGISGFLMSKGVMSFVSYPGAEVTIITAARPSNGRIWGNWRDSAGAWHAFTATPKQGSARASEEVASR
jgi:hypothetical protein